MQHIDITKLSETELKAVGFDIQNELAQMQNNLKMLAEELGKRVKEGRLKEQSAPAEPEPVSPPEAV
jgi:hypothetical protein